MGDHRFEAQQLVVDHAIGERRRLAVDPQRREGGGKEDRPDDTPVDGALLGRVVLQLRHRREPLRRGSWNQAHLRVGRCPDRANRAVDHAAFAFAAVAERGQPRIDRGGDERGNAEDRRLMLAAEQRLSAGDQRLDIAGVGGERCRRIGCAAHHPVAEAQQPAGQQHLPQCRETVYAGLLRPPRQMFRRAVHMDGGRLCRSSGKSQKQHHKVWRSLPAGSDIWCGGPAIPADSARRLPAARRSRRSSIAAGQGRRRRR